jgi:hypothetical protein
VAVLVRPDAASLAAPFTQAGENLVQGTLQGVSFRGSQVKITLGSAGDEPLVFELPGSAVDALPPLGQAIRLALDSGGIRLLKATGVTNIRSGWI